MEGAAASGGGMNLIIIVVLAGFFLMLLFTGRGEKKRAQALRTMIDGLQKDDKVVIFGGLVGTVTGFKDNMVEVKISENNKVTVLKSGIVRVIGK